MNRRNISPQAVRICGLTLLCLAIMFGVAAANKAKGGEKLVSEYTVQDDVLPRHVKFESMPADMPQMTAAWFYKYKGLGQFDMCSRLFPKDQLEALNFEQEDRDLKTDIIYWSTLSMGLKPCPRRNMRTRKPVTTSWRPSTDIRSTRWYGSLSRRNGLPRPCRRPLSGGTERSPGILRWAGKQGCGSEGRYLSWARCDLSGRQILMRQKE